MPLTHLVVLVGVIWSPSYVNGRSAKTCEGVADSASAFVKLLRLGVSFLRLDPLALPERSLEVPMLGGIALHDGTMSGLSTVRRTGVNSAVDDDTGFNMTIDLGTGLLAINYTTTLSMLFTSHDVLISIQVECTRISMHIKETADAMLALTSLSIDAMQGLDVRLQALKMADKLFNTFLKTATTLFKDIVKKVAEKVLHEVVNDFIEEINAML